VLELTNLQRKELHGALIQAFPTRSAMARMVDFELGENLAAITGGTSLNDVAYELLQWAEAMSALDRLVNAARAANPGNERLRAFEEAIVRDRNARPQDSELRQFADRVSLAPGPAAPTAQIERIVDSSQRFQDVDAWLGAQRRGELAVCLVEVGQQGRATGFLVGPDLVMTASYAITELVAGPNQQLDVSVRFDYRAYGDGQMLSQGQQYALAAEPIVDSSPLELLDYVILRLAGRAGDDPVAGQAGAPARGWLTPSSAAVAPGEVLFVIQHPQGGPLKFAHGPCIGPSTPATHFNKPPEAGVPRLLYEVPTEPGSGGAPVFSSDWELVAIHEGVVSDHDRSVKRGVPMAPIVERLRAKGIL